MSLRSLMRHRCTIKRNTTVNTGGVVTPSWATVATSQPCLVQEDRGRIQTGPAGEALEYDAIGYFPAAADLRPRGGNDEPDQIVMESPARMAGVTFLVMHVHDESGQDKLANAYLQRFRHG